VAAEAYLYGRRIAACIAGSILTRQRPKSISAKEGIVVPALNVTTDEGARCLEALEGAEAPMTAAQIAAWLRLSGSRETQRRRVRAIVEGLRKGGSMIVATLQEGYWLTDDAKLYKRYLAGRQIDAKKVLGKTHRKQREMLADSGGQGVLFRPTAAGWRTA